MDYKDIDFDPELSGYYKLCLNNGYVGINRIYCYCVKHECFVSNKQAKHRHCKENCKHKRLLNEVEL